MIDYFDLLAVQGTLKSLLQHHSSKQSMAIANYMLVFCVTIILLKFSSTESFPAILKISSAMTKSSLASLPIFWLLLTPLPFSCLL